MTKKLAVVSIGLLVTAVVAQAEPRRTSKADRAVQHALQTGAEIRSVRARVCDTTSPDAERRQGCPAVHRTEVTR